VVLDADVYDRARADLGDLRVVDDRGVETPYLLSRRALDSARPIPAPVLLNRGFVRGRSASVTLDLGAPSRHTGLVLSLGGDNFRRRVAVEGRHREDRAWSTLAESAYVFAVPGPPPLRFEEVPLPGNDFELLRVTVFRGPDDPPVLDIREATVTAAAPAVSAETPVARARFSPVAGAGPGETAFDVELGARSQPFRAIVLDVADPRFFREVVVEARRERPRGHRPAGHPRSRHSAEQRQRAERPTGRHRRRNRHRRRPRCGWRG